MRTPQALLAATNEVRATPLPEARHHGGLGNTDGHKARFHGRGGGGGGEGARDRGDEG